MPTKNGIPDAFIYPNAEIAPGLAPSGDFSGDFGVPRQGEAIDEPLPEDVQRVSELVEAPYPPKKRTWGQFFASLCGGNDKSEQQEKFIKSQQPTRKK